MASQISAKAPLCAEYVEISSSGKSYRLVVWGESETLGNYYIKAFEINKQQEKISDDLEAQLVFMEGTTIRLGDEMTLEEAQENIKLIKEEFERATCIEGRLLVKILSLR